MIQSSAQIILEAVRLSTDADIHALRRLTACYPHTLGLELILRLLLSYLPESTQPRQYIGLLQDLRGANISAIDEPALSDWVKDDTSEEDTRRQVRTLHLLPLSDPFPLDAAPLDTFTRFLLLRARQIEAETGSLLLVQELIEPFLDHSEYLRTWAISIILPLLRLDYEYHSNRVPPCSLDSFEKLQGRIAIDTLLSGAAQRSDGNQSLAVGRDLRGLVGPWMYGENKRKRRKLVDTEGNKQDHISLPANQFQLSNLDVSDLGWAEVNEWLLDLSTRDFRQSTYVIEQWGGPDDVDYGGWDGGSPMIDGAEVRKPKLLYMQAALATIYATNNVSSQTLESVHTVLRQVARLVELPTLPDLDDSTTPYLDNFPSAFHEKVTQSHMLRENLLNPSNPITSPSSGSVQLAYLIMASARILQSLGYSLAYRRVANLALFETSIEQRTELGKIFYTLQASRLTDERKWAQTRQKLLWLQRWNNSSDARKESLDVQTQGVFHHVNRVDFEVDILQAFLIATCYKLAVNTYCVQRDPPIPSVRVQKVVLDVALISYDSASNGNKTRGGVKKAFDILKSFRGSFPQSIAIKQTDALLSATHALSFYSLTLQHGVPLQPVNIRVHPDPISLIDKVLNQNPKSYTKLEDLLDIGRNLIKAGLVKVTPSENSIDLLSEERQIQLSEQRIIAMAVKAALAEDDFDTAYSYVMNRLSPSDSLRSDHYNLSPLSGADFAWQAAYKAGCCKTVYVNSQSGLRRLEQKMELLSQALLLAPTSAIGDILSTWRECEQEMNELLSQESDQEKKWDDQGDHVIPGGFSREDKTLVVQKPREPIRNAMSEEAPMGLFDVARGAATALSKTAFPLRSSRAGNLTLKASTEGSSSNVSTVTSPVDTGYTGLNDVDREGRIRKRDIVSNMVTGGLVSGIGWVLGAPSARPE